MTDYAPDTTGWYGWLTEFSIIPPEYHYITRVISSFFVTLALAPIIPVIVLVVYDFALWLWRLAAASLRPGRTEVVEFPKPPSNGIISEGLLDPTQTGRIVRAQADGLRAAVS